ncbi:hypothetical protein C5B98_13825 [Rathayibacter sp. AY1A5]|nr:hypothetical protein C5B98_13825 [Rathayibacter sp. AY1A5]
MSGSVEGVQGKQEETKEYIMRTSTSNEFDTSSANRQNHPGHGFRRSRIAAGLLAASLTVAVPIVGAAPAFADTTTQTTTAVADSGRATGVTEGANSGAAGQCTWGAKEKFFEATGLRPAIYGNALDWDTSAAANGWTTVLDAQARSIVVFEPGVQGADPTYGHVAWVDSVEKRADGLYINITEMNGAAGPGVYNTRTVQDVVGMSYILAP